MTLGGGIGAAHSAAFATGGLSGRAAIGAPTVGAIGTAVRGAGYTQSFAQSLDEASAAALLRGRRRRSGTGLPVASGEKAVVSVGGAAEACADCTTEASSALALLSGGTGGTGESTD